MSIYIPNIDIRRQTYRSESSTEGIQLRCIENTLYVYNVDENGNVISEGTIVMGTPPLSSQPASSPQNNPAEPTNSIGTGTLQFYSVMDMHLNFTEFSLDPDVLLPNRTAQGYFIISCDQNLISLGAYIRLSGSQFITPQYGWISAYGIDQGLVNEIIIEFEHLQQTTQSQNDVTLII